MKDYVVTITGSARVAIHIARRRAGSARIAVSEVLKRTPDFGLKWNGGKDRHLKPGEAIVITVCNFADYPNKKYFDK